ncbi:MAG: hypothetical protein K6B14_01900 [Lachnospiraceae bacterium]|nr:hypothetical protein [Lachnospiraceae bacterium]
MKRKIIATALSLALIGAVGTTSFAAPIGGNQLNQQQTENFGGQQTFGQSDNQAFGGQQGPGQNNQDFGVMQGPGQNNQDFGGMKGPGQNNQDFGNMNFGTMDQINGEKPDNEEGPGSAIKSFIEALEDGDLKTACEEAFEACETGIKAEIEAEHNDTSDDDMKALKKVTNAARKTLDAALEAAGADMNEILQIPEKKEGNKKYMKKKMRKDVIQEIEQEEATSENATTV